MMEFFFVGVYFVVILGGCKFDQIVIVFGVGFVGLLCMVVVKVLGVRRIIVVDINKERLEFVKSYVVIDVCIFVSILLFLKQLL